MRIRTTLDGAPVVFPGDVLPSEYTPNVGGADVCIENPLQRDVTFLRAIIDVGYERACPGHCGPIIDSATKAESIVRYHEERAWKVLTPLSTPLQN